jgi:hypothetical protein
MAVPKQIDKPLSMLALHLGLAHWSNHRQQKNYVSAMGRG